MKKLELLFLFIVLILALSLRLYKIDRPIADWHSWRQADTAAVARNFVKDGFNPLIPKFDDMSTQANTLDNPNRYRFVEFPVYNLLIAFVWKVLGTTNVLYARLTTVVLTLISTTLLYFLVRKYSDQKTALLSSFFFAAIPYNVFYSSTILPAPFMVTSLLALYLSFTHFLENQKILLLASSILFANLAILSWPIALFFMIPLIYLALDKYGISSLKKLSLYVFAVLSIAPFVAWRIWMRQYPEGIPNYVFLINEGGIRFKGAFFRWLIAERLAKLILTAAGFSLFILGLIRKPQNREKLFYLSYLFSVIVYFSYFASGNVRHDYYQIPAIPILSIYMAIGTKTLLDLKSNFINRAVAPLVALFLISFMFVFGFYEIRGYYWINRPQIVEAGIAVDRLLPKDATIVAPYGGDAAFLYQTNRRGYPITDRSLEKFIDNGTKYLVSVEVNDAGIQNLVKNCKVIEQTPNYVIVEMEKDCIGK